ncbi:MAG: hypothetical protein QW561_03495 [Candidatus Aenigmatarchaeota archaeon]
MTAYYWKIVARDNHGDERVSAIRSFTKANELIEYVIPNPCKTRHIVSIIGKNFGDAQGDSEIHLGAKVFGLGSSRILMWNDTRIDFKVPAYPSWPSGTTRTKKLRLKINSIETNKVKLSIIRP